MSKHERSSRREYRDSAKYDRYDRPVERESRKDKDTTHKEKESTRRRRHRSPSYDSYDDSSDYDSEYSRDPSPRRPSRRHTTAYSDSEDRGYRGRDRHRRARDYYSPSPSPERKGIVEDLLAAVGLIRSKHKDRSGGSSRDADDRQKNTKQALQAALTAAAVEAFRTRKEGKLTPQRLLQIAGAAIAAGGLDALVDSRSGGEGKGLRHVIESVVAGLATGKTMGKTIKQNRGGSMDNKLKSGLVGVAAKQLLGRSLSRGANRRRTNKW